MKKRIVSWLLVLVMVFGMIPMPTHAADAAEYQSNVNGTAQFNPALNTVSGEVITYGTVYITDNPSAGINWNVEYTVSLEGLMDQTFVIEACYVDDGGYWYKLAPRENETLPGKLATKSWVYQNDLPTSMYLDSLLVTPPVQEPSEPEETTKPSEPEVDNCDKCDDPECDGTGHVWCDKCEKYDCGENHNAPTDPSAPTEPDIPENLPLVDEATGITVSSEGIPEGAAVHSSKVSGEANAFDIKIVKDGKEWQPIDDGVTVTLSMPVSGFAEGEYVYVTHFIDYPADINGDEAFIPLEGAPANILTLLESAIDAYEVKYGTRDYVAVEGYYEQIKNGRVFITTDSFSAYVVDSTNNLVNINGTGFTDIQQEVIVTPGSHVSFRSHGLHYKFECEPEDYLTILSNRFVWVSLISSYQELTFQVPVDAKDGDTFSVTAPRVLWAGAKTVNFRVRTEVIDSTSPVYIAVQKDANTADSFYYYVDDTLIATRDTYLESNTEFVKESQIDLSSDKVMDNTTGHYGVRDASGSNRLMQYLNMPQSMIDDIITEHIALEAEGEDSRDPNDYKLVVYEIMHENGAWNIGLRVMNRNVYSVAYYLNAPTNYNEGHIVAGAVPTPDFFEYTQEGQEFSTTIKSSAGLKLLRTEGTQEGQTQEFEATFVGWSTNRNAIYSQHPTTPVPDDEWYEAGEIITFSDDVNLYAIWNPGKNKYVTADVDLTKVVVDSYGRPVDTGDRIFEFTIGGLPSGKGYSYHLFDNQNMLLSNGILTSEQNTFELKNGWHIRIHALPEKITYTFTESNLPTAGYCAVEPLEGRFDETINVSGEFYLTFTNTVENYTITYVDEQNVVSPASQTYNIESDSTLPTLSKPGYSFEGWKIAESSGSWNKDAIVAGGTSLAGNHGNVQLIAVWDTVEYTIEYVDEFGTVSPTTQSYNTKSTSVLPTLSKPGYSFEGWKVAEASGNWTKDDVVQGGTALTSKYGDVKLTAQWQLRTYHITYVLDGGTNHVNNPTTFNVEMADFELQNPTREGYRFTEWTCNIGTMLPPVVDVSQATDVTFTAHWVKTYTVTLNHNYNGALGTTTTVDAGSEYSLPTPERTTHRFLGWYTSATGGEKVESPITVNDDVELYAHWIHKDLDYPLAIGINMMYHDPNGKYHSWDVAGSAYHAFPVEPDATVDNNGIRASLYEGEWLLSFEWGNSIGLAGDYISEDIFSTSGYDAAKKGISDNTGAIIAALLGNRLSFDGLVNKWKTYGKSLCENKYDTDIQWELLQDAEFNVIPYVIKFVDGKQGKMWIIDVIIDPVYKPMLKYRANLDPNYGPVTVPADRWYVMNTVADVASISGDPSHTVDGLTYTARFLNWSDDDGKIYNANDKVTMQKNLTLTANWEYPVKYKVEHYLQNLDDNNYTHHSSLDSYSTGYVDEQTTAQSLDIDGYSVKTIRQQTIEEDGTVVKVYYDRKMYKVTYEITGVTDSGYLIPAEVSYKWDQIVDVAAAPQKEGYTFTDWTTTETINEGHFTMPKHDVVLTATCTANGYIVKFNANGGTGTMADQSFVYSVAQNISANTFTRTGYTFLGWSTDASAITATYNDKQSVSNLASTSGAVVTLYAVWKQNSYTVTYDDGDLGGTNDPMETYHYNDIVTIPAAPLGNEAWNSIHRFNGWQYGGNLYQPGDTSLTMPDSDITLEAQWLTKYTVKHHYKTLSDTDEVYEVIMYGLADEMTQATALGPQYGFSVDSTKEWQQKIIADDGSTVVDIYYVRNSYELTYIVDGDVPPDTVIQNGHTQSVLFRAPINLQTQSYPGYTFSGWSELKDADGNVIQPDENGVYRMPAMGVTVRGSWTQDHYQVTYSIADSALGVTAPQDSGSYTYDQQVILKDVTSVPAGYQFLGWKISGSGSDTYLQPGDRVTVTSNMTLVGYFEQITYKLTYIIYVDGAVAPDTVEYHYNGTVEIQNPKTMPEHYEFKGWATTIGGSDITSYEVGKTYTLTDNLTLHAVWSPKEYYVAYCYQLGDSQVVYEGNGAAVPEGYNEDFILKTPATYSGYKFEKWLVTEFNSEKPVTVKSEDGKYSFTMPGNHVVAIAKYIPNQDAGYTVYHMENDETDTAKALATTKVSELPFDSTHTVPVATIAGFKPVDGKTSITVTAGYDRVYYIYYEREMYTLAYYGNGITASEEKYLYGAEVTIKTPVYEGHNFVNWSGSDGNTYTAGQSIIMPASNLMLTANWTVNKYSLSYEATGLPEGFSVVIPATELKSFGEEVALATVPSVEGYEVNISVVRTDTNTSVPTNELKFSMPSSNTKVIWSYTAESYNISYDLAGGSLQNGVTNPATYTVQDTIRFSEPVRENYTFVGWQRSDGTVSAPGENAITEGTTGDLVFTAKWKLNTTTLTISVSGGDADQSYVFTVTGTALDGTSINLSVSVIGNSSRTIAGLPIANGTYTVTEKSGWTWRYTGDKTTAAEISTDGTYSANFSFGTVDNPYWLNDYHNGLFRKQEGGNAT